MGVRRVENRRRKDRKVNKAILSSAVVALWMMSANAGGKGMLILQCGSDWCESGEFVRQAFKSQEFRKALGGRFELAVYDEMENPTPKVKAENEKLDSLRVPTVRFPAITCLTGEPHRLFAQLENIPYDVTPKSLAEMVDVAVKNKDEVESLFKHGRGRGQSPADALGRGFEILESQVGEFDRGRLFEGSLAWEEQWTHLQEIDADDRYGWRLRFTMGDGYDLIAKATEIAKEGDAEKWEEFLTPIRAVPTNALSVVQRQSLELLEFAYAHATGSGSDSFSASDADVMHRILDMDRNTIWGQFALGKLIQSGETIETVKPYRVKVRPRSEGGKRVAAAFKLRDAEDRVAAITPGKDGFTEAEKRTIALYAVLRRIGERGWNDLRERQGSAAFMRDFLYDRKWMEDFAWSGKCSDWRSAILALESLYFQDGGRWIDGDGPGRRFATATALESPQRDEAWLADWLDAYRTTAQAKRLHKSALEQDVWLWRFAIRNVSGDGKADPPNEQRFLEQFYNVPISRFGSAMWVVPYRMYNCFGSSVFSTPYYEPWVVAGEWPFRRFSHMVGGVCGELSYFASHCSNSHGLPSMPVGQPGHCAFTRRMLDGSWVIDYSIQPPTGFEGLWHNSKHWTYTVATEETFSQDREKRMDADRCIELARLAESRGNDPAVVSNLYISACKACPRHYTAWRGYSDWIVRSARPLEEHRAFLAAAVKGLEGLRHPLWDLMTPYFSRVEKGEGGAKALADALVEFAPATRQGDDPLPDEGNICDTVQHWTKSIEGDPDLMERVAFAFVSEQYGTRTFFTQTLGWCAKFVFADEARSKRFVDLFPKMAAKFEKSMRGKKGASKIIAAAKNGKPDLGSFIEQAESSGDLMAFRQFAAMQEKVGTPEKGVRFKDKDFGGDLVSAEGMLSLSGYFFGDTPSLHPKTIDASVVKDYTFCAGDKYTKGHGERTWAMVTLAGPCELKGIVLVNRTSDEEASKLQVPFVVEVSEDNVSWQEAFSQELPRKSYRFEFKFGHYPRAKYVRVRRIVIPVEKRKKTEVDREMPDTLRMSKILVYGKKLY